MDFASLAQECAAGVHVHTMAAVVSVESGFNPYAIGVVGGVLVRQPSSKVEAVATAHALERAGWNFSVGIAQVNRHNLRRSGLDYEAAFDACSNLRAGSRILADCFSRAQAQQAASQDALRAALSCYYSGNFSRGFMAEASGTSYVERVIAAARVQRMGGTASARPAISRPEPTRHDSVQPTP